MTTETTGKVTISRVSSTMSEDYISIEIITPTMIIKAKMTLQDYARVSSGQGRLPADITIYELSKRTPGNE